MIIREFEPEDINKGLLETYKEVWFINEINEQTLNEWLSNDNYMIVAEDDKGVIVGTCTLHLQKKFIRDGGIAGLIEDVAVRKSLRGQNVGSLLVQKTIELAKNKNCYKVILSCFPERVAFYERNGFIQESLTMRHNLK
jgi:glucosamine-phosphate N-acetyltransferase